MKYFSPSLIVPALASHGGQFMRPGGRPAPGAGRAKETHVPLVKLSAGPQAAHLQLTAHLNGATLANGAGAGAAEKQLPPNWPSRAGLICLPDKSRASRVKGRARPDRHVLRGARWLLFIIMVHAF